MTSITDDLVTILRDSTRTTLSQYTVATEGPKHLINQQRRISVFYDKNRLNMQTFDSDDRIKSFILFFNFKKLSYSQAHAEFDLLITDIFQELYTNKKFTWSEYMTIGDIDNGYNDNGVLNQATMELLFNIEEDYSQTITEFDDVNLEGELR